MRNAIKVDNAGANGPNKHFNLTMDEHISGKLRVQLGHEWNPPLPAIARQASQRT
jgi:hypothetical protein